MKAKTQNKCWYRHTWFSAEIDKNKGNVGRHTRIFQQTGLKLIGNVARHTWLTADNDKKQWKC